MIDGVSWLVWREMIEYARWSGRRNCTMRSLAYEWQWTMAWLRAQNPRARREWFNRARQLLAQYPPDLAAGSKRNIAMGANTHFSAFPGMGTRAAASSGAVPHQP